MRMAAIFLAIGLSLCLLGKPPAPVSAQDDDDSVRGAFMTSRAKTTDKPKSATAAKPNRRRPKPTSTGNSGGNTAKSGQGSKSTDSTEGNGTGKTSVPAGRIGLGMTLFMRDSNGLAVRVDPAHEFHKGDRVRVLLETNVDGHLYIFNTTDGGAPVMIYPDPQLDEAGNYLKAHVPVEVPSSLATEERLRWFRFDEKAGVERLFFVFTKEPIPGVPMEDDLTKLCSDPKAACAWSPAAELWAQLQKDLANVPQIARNKNYGAAQTRGEHDATTRGIGLAQDDPEPAVVMMSSSNNSARLVTALDLIHK